MALFQSITLGWNGKDYTVPADRVLGAIGVVEDVVTFPELCAMVGGKYSMSRLACAYGALMRYAGAIVSDEEVYDGLFKPGEQLQRVSTALNTLLAMMTPPSAIAEASSEGNAQPSRSRSSRPSSRRRSAAAG